MATIYTKLQETILQEAEHRNIGVLSLYISEDDENPHLLFKFRMRKFMIVKDSFITQLLNDLNLVTNLNLQLLRKKETDYSTNMTSIYFVIRNIEQDKIESILKKCSFILESFYNINKTLKDAYQR